MTEYYKSALPVFIQVSARQNETHASRRRRLLWTQRSSAPVGLQRALPGGVQQSDERRLSGGAVLPHLAPREETEEKSSRDQRVPAGAPPHTDSRGVTLNLLFCLASFLQSPRTSTLSLTARTSLYI